MREYVRNLAVGTTVIVALGLLGGMILLFTGLPAMFQRGYEVRISSYTTHDTHEGDIIHLSGMRIGRITEIDFADPDRPTEGVTFVVRIDPDVRLPGNCKAYFFAKGVMGGAYIGLKADGPPRYDEEGNVLEFFPTDGSIVMESEFVGSGLIPPELTDAMKSLSDLAKNLNVLIAPEPAPPATGEAVPGTQPTAPGGIRGTIGKLNRALDAMSTVLGDVENQRNIKTSLANLAKATAAATEAMEAMKAFADEARKTASAARTTAEDFSKLAGRSQQRMDDIADKLIVAAENVSELMATINRSAGKIESGEGTAGKLLNDPELYNSFLSATKQLNQLMGELRQMVEIWKEGGIEIKLK